ncbi:ribosomal protein L5 [Wallemia mellicola]|uniref:Ribosomal protein L5 n=2 Tax=Wallemia mellicola TaxID=1708541 RepID=A0A4T0SAB4_9BASI|nr:ribosomal protein L5 [Wallemia mellicola CBS 633.66]TIB76007.1 hypothetical protein E3Q23_02074 [Wallemia mellicola]EIM20444.1 ribosomal protein L5 [Wallemia mellicola CBS 633.66]TIB77594.1 ribosomal protein L5 [Wallemia mellicola]TIB84585.1 ribosomal protein L5 [Wallemia mellicola]TIB87811.1 ribosomal protein L5 [Wallemia mellicola]|eukprot:XP_006959470.1 ribosomal protein L5 [Wallemia mellicola CBS 633.66]
MLSRTAAILRQQPSFYVGATHQPRLKSHYENTLAPALLYMNYNARDQPQTKPLPSWDAQDPYTAHRQQPRPRGNRDPLPNPTVPSAKKNIKLEKVIIHTMVKESIVNKGALLSAIMALQSISGQAQHSGGDFNTTGVTVCKARKGVAQWKIRQGMPLSVKVELTGDKMYDFVDALTEFVLPRMRDFSGVSLPPVSADPKSPSASSGVFQMGLPPAAMSLFPQIEAAFDSYPRSHGMDIKFITNYKGYGAEAKTRALMSGLRIPFVPK